MDYSAPLQAIRGPETNTYVESAIVKFLLNYRVSNDSLNIDPLYVTIAREMHRQNRSSLYVNFSHLQEVCSQGISPHDQQLIDVIQHNHLLLEKNFCNAVYMFLRDSGVPELSLWADEIQRDGKQFFDLAFFGLPLHETPRGIRTRHIGQLVAITGTLIRVSDMRPELRIAKFLCKMCNFICIEEQNYTYSEPLVCPRCVRNGTGMITNFELLEDASTYCDWQILRVQESAARIPTGSIPRYLDVILRGSAVESCKPGDDVILTGSIIAVPDILSQLSKKQVPSSIASRSNTRGDEIFSGVRGLKKLGSRDMKFRIMLAAKVVETKRADWGGERSVPLAPATFSKFEEISKKPNVLEIITSSVAPEICGREDVKLGILILLVGGVRKVTPDGTALRGDINVLLVGDAATGKTALLRWAADFAPRGIYTSGKTSTAAGLTASVSRTFTGDPIIEPGAVMLADHGVCAIDDFNQMNGNDETALHEVMEQQTISIAKAGVQATLNARCSILGAAAPRSGRYNLSQSLVQNVGLPPPIMSRFDICFTLLENESTELTEKIAQHVINRRISIGVDRLNLEGLEGELEDQDITINLVQEPALSEEELKGYISIARKMQPSISPMAQKSIIKYYVLLRSTNLSAHARNNRTTVRHLESLIRLSEACAALRLKEVVLSSDVATAFALLKNSSTPIGSEMVALEEEHDEPEIRPEPISLNIEKFQLIHDKILNLFNDDNEPLFISDIVLEVLESCYEAEDLIEETALEAADTVVRNIIRRMELTDRELLGIESNIDENEDRRYCKRI